jgi:hypothetical protein
VTIRLLSELSPEVQRKWEELYADHLRRRAPITHTTAGKEVREKLWDDIWRECLSLDGKLEPLKRQTL